MRISLIIYVKKYDDENIVDLKKTSDDASDLKAFLQASLPEEYQFQVEYLDNPSARDVAVALKKIKKKLLEAEKAAKEEGRKEQNLFLFYFGGHGFDRPDGMQYLLCADALDVDTLKELIGGIGPATLEEFTNGLTQTDVVFWLDACRGYLFRDKGEEKCELEQFRTVCHKLPDLPSVKELRIHTCAHKQKAADDGLTMRVALDMMKESLKSGREILLDSTFTELWAERLDKTRKGNRQTPVAYGRPILLAPGVKSSEDVEKERLRQKLEKALKKISDLEKENSSSSGTAQIESLQKQLDDALRTISDLKQAEKTSRQDDLTEFLSGNVENDRSQAANESLSVVDKLINFLTPLSSAGKEAPERKPSVKPDEVWKGTRTGKRREIEIKGTTYGFRYCPPGAFMMGSPESEEGRYSDEIQHKVTLTRGFWMLETSVTQGLWTSIMGNNPSWFCSTGNGSSSVRGTDTTNFPVECVSWEDCQNFIKKLNKLLGMTFKLPTEAQWEYACRAGTQTAYWWGDALNGDRANCDGNYPCGTNKKGKYLGRTCAVKSYGANPWGLYDCHGNVWEWCADWKGSYPSGAVTDPVGSANASERVLRGGGWFSFAEYCRSAYRLGDGPANRNYFVGFRLLLE